MCKLRFNFGFVSDRFLDLDNGGWLFDVSLFGRSLKNSFIVSELVFNFSFVKYGFWQF